MSSSCFSSLDNSGNVFSLTLDDVYLLQNGKSLDIINAENDSMIGVYEGDWIIEEEIKKELSKD